LFETNCGGVKFSRWINKYPYMLVKIKLHFHLEQRFHWPRTDGHGNSVCQDDNYRLVVNMFVNDCSIDF